MVSVFINHHLTTTLYSQSEMSLKSVSLLNFILILFIFLYSFLISMEMIHSYVIFKICYPTSPLCMYILLFYLNKEVKKKTWLNHRYTIFLSEVHT